MREIYTRGVFSECIRSTFIFRKINTVDITILIYPEIILFVLVVPNGSMNKKSHDRTLDMRWVSYSRVLIMQLNVIFTAYICTICHVCHIWLRFYNS